MSSVTNNQNQAGRTVPFGEKSAYGIGMLANQLYPAVISVFTVFLVMALNMDPLLAGVLAAAPRIFDAISDPIMGFVTDNTKSRWGRRRPYIFIGAFITGFAFMAMWQLYPENSEMYNFYYFLGMSLLFYLGITIFSTPLVALGYEMSSDYHERTSIMAISQWIGQIAWIVAPWAWVIIFMESLFADPAEGCRELAVWVGFICIIFAIVPAIFCKEPKVPEGAQAELSMAKLGDNLKYFLSSVTETFKCGPFIILCIATFLVFNAYMAITQFQYFIFVHYVFGGDTDAVGSYPAWYGTIAACATCFLVIPIIAFVSKRIGKRNAFIIAMSISVVGYTLKFWFFSPETPWLIFFTLPLTSFGIGGLFTLMMSMTSDVCDLDEYNNGKRREGMFAAVYWWFVKLGTALSLFISGATLKLVGFDQSPGAIQSVETLTQLRIADAVIPAVGTALAVILMFKYKVGEKEANDVRAELEARHKQKEINRVKESNKDESELPGSSPLLAD